MSERQVVTLHMFRRILVTIFLCNLDTGGLDARSTIPREYGFAVSSFCYRRLIPHVYFDQRHTIVVFGCLVRLQSKQT
jgi:hypothetical protein